MFDSVFSFSLSLIEGAYQTAAGAFAYKSKGTKGPLVKGGWMRAATRRLGDCFAVKCRSRKPAQTGGSPPERLCREIARQRDAG